MLKQLVYRLTSAKLLRTVALAGAVGWSVAFVCHFCSLTSLVDKNGEPVGGDFISLYAAARLVLEGHAPDLYDLALQQKTQGQIVGSADYHALCSFVNPPAVAVVFAPLALLPYRLAYLTYTALLLVAFLLAMRFLRPWLPALRQHWSTVVCLSFMFYPIAVTVTGGQNTALTLLLIAAIYGCLRRGQDAHAGVALGLLFYKPQFAPLLCLLLLTGRRFRCVAVAGGIAIAYYLIGAAHCGFAWPVEMTRTLATYWPLENQFNGLNSISILGFCEAVLPAHLFKTVGLCLSGALVAALLWAWRGATPRGDAFASLWGLAVCVTVLVSPHTQWYDSGLMLLAVLLALNDQLERGQPVEFWLRAVLLAGFLLVPCYRYAGVLGWQPMIFLPLLTTLWLSGRLGARTTSVPLAFSQIKHR